MVRRSTHPGNGCQIWKTFFLFVLLGPSNICIQSLIHNTRIKSQIRRIKLSSSFLDTSFIEHGIHTLDQFIQGALNQATSTPELMSSQTVTTSVPELNILTIDEPSGSLNPLGNDLLIFLCSTIGIVPLFKWLKASPVIGFLTAGLLMGPAGLHMFSDLHDMEALADFGVLFLLFEQGLELTVDRLKSLSKFAFGMGTLQVVLCTAAFFIFPFIGGVQFLEFFIKSDAAVVDITRVDEAVVIGAALSLSSSAFVLKILQEKGQLTTKFGAASLGILLLQDIAVVPLLVLLPIIESNSGPMPLSAQLSLLGATFVKAILGLGGILVIGGRIVRYLFSLVAQTRSSETFVALCLLVALGTGALTDALGLSSTLGAFTAGTLLAESNYRTQIESDIKPFRGLLLGLFFLTTGASVDPIVIQQQWPTVLALLAGLISFKAAIITLLGPLFSLTKAESIRTGLLLSGGGEFAFVVLTLADKLGVLPDQLAKILVGVVVLSMALTPTLSELADKAAAFLEERDRKAALDGAIMSGSIAPIDNHSGYSDSDVIVICGFGPFGEMVARFLTTTTAREKASPRAKKGRELKYVAFDLDPKIVVSGFKSGKNILYGDGSQPKVLATAGIESPKAFVVTYSDAESAVKSVERLRLEYPTVPILCRATEASEQYELKVAGSTLVVPDERESSMRISKLLMENLGFDVGQIKLLSEELRVDLEHEDSQQFEARIAKKAGTVITRGTDRVNSPDEYYEALRTAISKRLPMASLDDVQRRLQGIIGAKGESEAEAEGFAVDSIEYRMTEYGYGDELDESDSSVDAADAGINELGVTVCVLPPKRSDPTKK